MHLLYVQQRKVKQINKMFAIDLLAWPQAENGAGNSIINYLSFQISFESCLCLTRLHLLPTLHKIHERIALSDSLTS